MIKEDQGIMRFIYEIIQLDPFSLEEARDFLDLKFSQLVKSTRSEKEEELFINPEMIDRIVQLSGGHPHLLQLLGSHVVENEYSNPDGEINIEDLVGSLQKICYQQRAPVYDLLIHDMKKVGKYISYLKFLELSGGTFPSKVDTKCLENHLDEDEIEWLLFRNILIVSKDNDYELTDELLKVRIMMDRYNDIEDIENELINYGELDNQGAIIKELWYETDDFGIDN